MREQASYSWETIEIDCLTVVLYAATVQEFSGHPYGTAEPGCFRQLYRHGEAVGGEVAGEEISRRLHSKLPSSTSPGISKYALARGRMSWLVGDNAAPMCELNNDKGIPTLFSEQIPKRWDTQYGLCFHRADMLHQYSLPQMKIKYLISNYYFYLYKYAADNDAFRKRPCPWWKWL